MPALKTFEFTHVRRQARHTLRRRALRAQSAHKLSIVVCALLLILSAFVSFSPAAFAQANVQGQWVTLNTQMPVNPIHLALMHNGKVLVIAGSGNLPSDTTYLGGVWNQRQTR